MRIRRKNHILLPILIIFIAGECLALDYEWPTFKHNFQRTSYTSAFSNYSLSELDLLWKFSTGDMIRSSPVVVDLDGDGLLEVIVGSFDGTLYFLDSQGTLIHNFTIGSRIRSTPTVADLEDDGCREIIVGADNGVLYTFNCTRSLIWNFTIEATIETSPLVANLDDSKQKEIVFGASDGQLYALDYKGNMKWDYRTQSAIRSSVAVADTTGDAKQEMVFGSEDGILYILSFPPYKIWQFQTSGAIPSTPAVSDYDVDGRVEVIFTSTDKKARAIYYHTYSGLGDSRRVCETIGNQTTCRRENYAYTKFSSEWNYTTGSYISSSPAVADLDADGKLETIFGSNDKILYVINSTGSKIMRYSTNKPIESSPAIADLNNDGSLEIIFGSNDKRLYVINYPEGGKWLYETDGAIRSSPAVADLTGDGSLEIIVGSDDGNLYVFGSMLMYRKSNASIHYSLAEAAYKMEEIENALQHVNKSLKIYEEIDDLEGITKCNAFIKRVEADGYTKLAKEFQNKSMFEDATKFIEKAALIYSAINYQKGIDDVRDILQRNYADANYLDAEYFYDIGDFHNATFYANRSEFVANEIDYKNGSYKASRLLNITVKHLIADEIYAEAVNQFYHTGYSDNITALLEEVRSLYAEINYRMGLNVTDKLIKRMNADRYYDFSLLSYNDSLFEDAKELIDSSLELYAELNYTPGIEKTSLLLNRTQSYIQAGNYYKDSESLYTATDFRSALDNAKKAKDLYEYLQDDRELAKTEILIERAQERSGKNGGVLPKTSTIIISAFILVIIGLRLRRYRAVHKKKIKVEAEKKKTKHEAEKKKSGESIAQQIVGSLDEKIVTPQPQTLEEPTPDTQPQQEQADTGKSIESRIENRLPSWFLSFEAELYSGFPKLRSNPPKLRKPQVPKWLYLFKDEMRRGFPKFKAAPPKFRKPQTPTWLKNFSQILKKKIMLRRKEPTSLEKSADEEMDLNKRISETLTTRKKELD